VLVTVELILSWKLREGFQAYRANFIIENVGTCQNNYGDDSPENSPHERDSTT
jgi:hypothetical protein